MDRKIITYLFIFFVLFVIYNTLIPFRFDYGLQDLGTRISKVEWRPFSSENGRVSLTDVVGNIILFVPFGFLLYRVLYYAGKSWPILWSVVASAAFSFSIEFIQLFIEVRSTSPHDLINNTLGGLIGASCAAVYSANLSSINRKIFYDLLSRKPFLLIVITIGLLQSIAAIMPFTVSITISDLQHNLKGANLIPFAYQSVGNLFLSSPNRRDELPFDSMAFVGGLIFWTVIGYLLALCYRSYWKNKSYGRLLLVGLPIVYFPMVELVQLFIVSRISDINDIICGYLGAAVGIVLYYILRPVRRKMFHTDLDLLKIPLLMYGVFTLFSGLQPFDWTFSFANLAGHLKLEILVPFHAYFRKTSLWNIYDLAASLIFFVPIGLYWTCRLREKGYGWAQIYFLTTLSGFLVGALIEVAQFFSATRVAEITNALAYGLGGAIGTFLIYYDEQEVRPLLASIRSGDLKVEEKS